MDVGDRRVGVAVSDALGVIASPLAVIHRTSKVKDFAAIERLVREHSVDGLVVGHPLNDDGSAGPQARRIERYVDGLCEALQDAGLHISVELWDERMSTQQAQALMIDSGRSVKHRKEWLDAAAAAVILQEYLDEKARPHQ